MSAGAVIGRTIAESTPRFTPIPRPPDGAPNVVVIVLDDLGFAQLGCFGSDIDTPVIDGLAERGLRYNHFHVTALCSPTRASLLTGRNHHRVGMGFLTDVPIGFPGYTGRIPPTAGTLPRILRDAGYSTFAVGKWHLAPRWEQSASGPFDRWPLGLGFERYYGFLAGDTNQWTPDLVRDNGFIEPPARPEDGYHLTEDLADQAVRLVLDQQHATPGKPFFLYFATGAVHAPHQVPEQWVEPYRGRFDGGWEAWREATFRRQRDLDVVPRDAVLTSRPSWVQEWASLPADERRLFARMMEVFAGFLTHTDAQIGRVLAGLDRIGVLDDTLVMVISDNGTSAEGGPLGTFNEHRFTHDMQDDVADTVARIAEIGGFRAYNHYPWGWAWAGNTPFRLWKRYAWLGGTRTPLVVHWPGRLAGEGGVRRQFCHAVDLAPTVLDAAGVPVPERLDGVDQLDLDGASLVPTFTDADAPAGRRVQYFEMLGSRSIYADGWKATTDHVGKQLTVEVEQIEGSLEFAEDRWSLFDLATDFSESTDLADAEPERLQAMVEEWWAEAGRNQVLPLDDSFIGRAVALEPAPFQARHRSVYRPGGTGVAEDLLPPMGGGFRLHASVEVPHGGARPEGVLAALGDWSNGWALYLLEGRPVMTFNLFGQVQQAVAEAAVPAGLHTVTVDYAPRAEDPSQALTVAVDGEVVAAAAVEGHLPFRWQIGGAGMVLGHDRGFPVCDDYVTPFPFTATLHDVTIEIPRLAPRDPATEVARALRHE